MGTFRFQEGVNTLIGENGSGKSNALQAIRLLLDGTLPRNSGNLLESDFNRCLQDWRGHWIILSVVFANLDKGDAFQALKHKVSTHDGKTAERGTYSLLFRPNRSVRTKLFEASGDKDAFESARFDIRISDYETLFTARAHIDYSAAANYLKLVGDLDNHKAPDPSLESSKEIGVTFHQISTEIDCTFVKALRDVASDMRNARENPLVKLLQDKKRKIELAGADHIIDGVKKLNLDIADLPQVNTISQNLQRSLLETVGHTYSPTVAVTSGLPEDLHRVLQRLSLCVVDEDRAGYQGNVSELSLGAANMIYFSLKLLEYESNPFQTGRPHFLLIEEPEAHIHTHLQMTLFKKALAKPTATQIILTTHSTHLSSVSKISQMNILSSRKNNALVQFPSSGVNPSECKKIERYLDATRSSVLFAKGVILVEGDAELILVPAMVESVFGVSMDELGLSIVNMSSTVFSHISNLFHPSRIQRYCAIVTDNDAPIEPLPADPLKDSPSQKAARQKLVNATNRIDGYRNSHAINKFANVFATTHTFEVALVPCIREEICSALKVLYTQAPARSSAQALIRSTDLPTYGKEVLRLADTFKKGWFALELAEHIKPTSIIPSYILEAIAFASSDSISLSISRNITANRLDHQTSNQAERDNLKARLKDPKQSTSDILDSFKNAFPEDPFTELLQYVKAT
jgi:putative ATP-dependent endonuclease of OLD family